MQKHKTCCRNRSPLQYNCPPPEAGQDRVCMIYRVGADVPLILPQLPKIDETKDRPRETSFTSRHTNGCIMRTRFTFNGRFFVDADSFLHEVHCVVVSSVTFQFCCVCVLRACGGPFGKIARNRQSTATGQHTWEWCTFL